MSKKEVLGIVLAGLFNFLVYDAGVQDFQKVGEIYNGVNCRLNPGKKEEERKVSVTLAIDTKLSDIYGEEEILSVLEAVLQVVSEKSKLEAGISFEVKDKFVYDSEEKIYGSIRVREASMKVPRAGNELRVVYTYRPISYREVENGEAVPVLGIATIKHNICLIYFDKNIHELVNTTLHEILHTFGAEHVDDKSSIMYPDTDLESTGIDKKNLETILFYKNKKFF